MKVTKEMINDLIKEVKHTRINETMTHCQIIMKCGFAFSGESACIDPANYDQAIGEKIAYENAYDKIWSHMGFYLMMIIPVINWSEERQSNDEVRYNHIVFRSPIEEFTIEWKGWKENPHYVCRGLDGVIDVSAMSLEAAKESFKEQYMRIFMPKEGGN